jgi:hypothetical protein
MMGTFPVASHPALILFDSGASHTFISKKFVEQHHIACHESKEGVKSHAPGDNSGDSPPYPSCSAVVADKFTDESRLPALCHVPEYLHRIVVSLSDSPLIAGMTATVEATNPLRQYSSSSSDRRASTLKFPATVVDPYKLKPPPAPQGHHTPSHQKSLAIVRQRA